MNKRKLELYEDLFQKMGPGTNKVTIEQIATAFMCSERHTRTLLKQMSEMNWLTWAPARGRGKRGELNCVVEPIDACYAQVDKAIESAKYEQAHQLVSFNKRDAAVGLKQYLERTSSQNERTIYAPFHRKIGPLHPHNSIERTERHLIHEVFQTLVTYDGSELIGDLAHHWESDKGHMNWTFHLRSSAIFHDQSAVTAIDVVESLKALSLSVYWQRLYDHISDIEIASLHCIIIRLKTKDPSLPLLLSRAEAAIMPKHSIYQPDMSYLPIGSGPFLVEINSTRVLRLARNDQYSGHCALIERIELWIHPEWDQDKKCAENFFFLDGDENKYKVSTSDIGYFFILLNHSELQTTSIKNSLVNLFQCNDQSSFEWPFPISFSYENNNENRNFARKLVRANSTISKKPIGRQHSYGRAVPNQDLAIGGIRLEGDRVTSLFAFLKLYPFWSKNLTWEQHGNLANTLNIIRKTESPTQRETLIDGLITDLYNNNVFAIFKSESLTLTVPSRVRNVEINSIGWCDFAKLWVNPD